MTQGQRCQGFSAEGTRQSRICSLGAQLCPSVRCAGHLTQVPWLLLLLISLGLFLLMLATLVQGKSEQGWERVTGVQNAFRLTCLLLGGEFCFYFIYYFIFALVKQELQHGTVAELLDFPPVVIIA